ncbi:MAG: hypothetical protein NTV01_11215 [Bacteroidia bacterium]|nr:hypothetical protein [Bacteroidia bacterium]
MILYKWLASPFQPVFTHGRAIDFRIQGMSPMASFWLGSSKQLNHEMAENTPEGSELPDYSGATHL